MRVEPYMIKFLAVAWFCGVPIAATSANSEQPGQGKGCAAIEDGGCVLWRDPSDIATRNLYLGPGGEAHIPRAPFKFEKEDMNGSSPKFLITDQDGIRWTVKLGDEARPEIAASRLVWAVGYFVNEEYFLPKLRIDGMPRLRRGQKFVLDDGTTVDARLKRHNPNQRKTGTWSWANNPFTGTHEWYRLRVLMAVINNWDLKDSNTAIFQVLGDRPERLYLISDLGASFGSPNLNWSAKGDLKAYQRSKLVKGASTESVDFNVPGRPKMDTFVDFPELVRRLDLRWLGQKIPIADVTAMSELLQRLSPQQIRDAFRAADYPPEKVEAFSRVVEARIAELARL